MRVRDQVARQYWLLASIEEVRLRCEEDGFTVTVNARVGAHEFDLFAERGDVRRVFEFKTYGFGKADRDIVALRNFVVHTLRGEFQLVWVAPPRERQIEVAGLEIGLRDWLMDNVPSALDSLSPHTFIDDVSEAFIATIAVAEDRIEISGEGTVEVTLEIDKEPDSSFSDAYPFTFRAVLDNQLNVARMEEFEVDTSSFYE